MILEVLFRALKLMETEGVPAMVMGGLAVRTLGLPRSTYDVDLTLSLDPGRVGELCRAAEAAGFSVPEVHLKGFADTLKGMRKFTFQTYGEGRPYAVDCFLVTTEYQRAAVLGVTALLDERMPKE